jgi:DNA polymerase-3 subunit beta
LLAASESGLRVTATDTEVAFIGDLAANVEKNGELAVDANNLFQIVRSLSEPTVHLLLGAGQRLEIRCGKSFFRLPGVQAEEYPAIPAFNAQGVANMQTSVIRRLVEQSNFAVATDDSRYGLNGAHVEEINDDNGRRLRMVATDGHRLSASEGTFEGDLAITPRMLLPRKALNVMRKLFDGHDEAIEIAFGEGTIRLKRPGQVFWFRLLEGEFPDYKAVLPSECKHRVTMKCTDLASALKRAGILIQERSRAVRFHFSDDQLEIACQNVDHGEVKELVTVELDGDAITMGFNISYLKDILGVLSGQTIQFEMSHHLGPCLIRDPSDVSAFFVVMPMRLD